MARGAESKSLVARKILETFEGSFLYNEGKEIRIPLTENGEIIQVKVTLSAAKENVEPGMDTALPEAPKKSNLNDTSTTNSAFDNGGMEEVVLTDAEKTNVQNLLASLGL